MKLHPHSMWLQGAILEANALRHKTYATNTDNTPTVLLYLRDHQPCSVSNIHEATGLAVTSVAAIIGTGVRAGRLRFTLEKVAGQPRKVKFYSEVI